MTSFLSLALLASSAWGAEIVLPAGPLERSGPVRIVYRTNQLATGKGELSIRWTDVHERTVEDRKIPVELIDEAEIGFTLDLRRAAAMRNTLTAHFHFEGANRKGAPDHREEDAKAEFIASPPDRAWWDYNIIMWQQHPPAQAALLKSLGINGGEWVGRGNRAPGEFLLGNDLRWYAENISTDFYSEYHRYFPDRPVNWKFAETREASTRRTAPAKSRLSATRA